MIGLIITDEEIAEDKRAFEYFHSLRKGSSSKRERWAAWQQCEDIRRRRQWRAWRSHPVAPRARWLDLDNTAPKGWTYEHLRSLEPDEVDVLFPGAVAAFATQCDDIPASRFVFDQWGSKHGKLRLSVPLRIERYGCTTWMPEMKLWRRYSKSFRNRPTYLDNEGTRCSVCGHLTLCRHAVSGAPHPHD